MNFLQTNLRTIWKKKFTTVSRIHSKLRTSLIWNILNKDWTKNLSCKLQRFLNYERIVFTRNCFIQYSFCAYNLRQNVCAERNAVLTWFPVSFMINDVTRSAKNNDGTGYLVKIPNTNKLVKWRKPSHWKINFEYYYLGERKVSCFFKN